MSMGKSDGSSKPIWADAQKEVRDDVFRNLLFPQAFGGAPDAGTEASINRGREGLTEQLATQGLSGTGLAGRAVGNYEQGALQDREKGRQAVIDRILAPLGQSSNQSALQLGSR
jgi:hypothetical protein